MRWDSVPEGGWLCFQCGMRITSIPEAQSHFGEYREHLPPECIRVARRLMDMGLRKGYSPNITVNLRDLEGWDEE